MEDRVHKLEQKYLDLLQAQRVTQASLEAIGEALATLAQGNTRVNARVQQALRVLRTVVK